MIVPDVGQEGNGCPRKFGAAGGSLDSVYARDGVENVGCSPGFDREDLDAEAKGVSDLRKGRG